MSFNLNNGTQTATLDPSGHTLDSSGKINGKWTVDANNNIVVDNGTTPKTNFPVTWKFITDPVSTNNLLQVSDASGNSGTFDAPSPGDPTFEDFEIQLVDNAIEVTPAKGFSFELQAQYAFTSDFDLTVTINSTASTIKGLLQDGTALHFQFFYSTATAAELDFTGEWDQSSSTSAKLQFDLTPNAAGGQKTIAVNIAIGADPNAGTINFSYTKSGNAETFSISADIVLNSITTGNTTSSLSIQFQATVGGASPTYTLELAYTFKGGTSLDSTQISLTLTDTSGATGDMLTIAGSYQLQKGADGSVSINFNYASKSGGTTAVTFGLSIKATWQAGPGGSVVLTINLASGNQLSLSLTGNFTTGNATVSFGITISNDPSGTKVTGFLEIHF